MTAAERSSLVDAWVGPGHLAGFDAQVQAVRAHVTAILTSETADGTLCFRDDGTVLYAGGLWNASIWARDDERSLLELTCAKGMGSGWRVMVRPIQPTWEATVLEWPTDAFERELRATVATLHA